MTSFSSPPPPPPPSSSLVTQIKYDVFISFRGSDTRRGFLSHLLKALGQKKIETYVDYKLKEGNEVLPALLTAIEESQIALILFSEDYASSKCCLEEVVKITECMKKNGQIVVPVFYNIDPSNVRHQKGFYKDAFDQHEKLFKDNMMNVEKWRAALKKVAHLSGLHSSNFGTEAELIEEIVQRVLTRLNHMYQVDLKGLVGIDKPIADLESLIFCNGSEDVRIIGVWGMGGIGKTTIVGALFNILCSEYEACSFLADVREQSEKCGTIQLKDKLLTILLEERDLNIGVPNGVPAYVVRRLRRKKILVVLDDVDNPDQIRNLVGGHDWFGPGSRIIVTTRDKHVTSKEADDIYEVKALDFHDAQQLFNLHASTNQKINLHELNQSRLQKWLMLEAVKYTKGIPLALKVLGSLLYDKSTEEWESQLKKLQKMPCAEIQNALRLSYDGLDREERSIFLYIACFFKGDGKEHIKVLLDACGYSTTIALKTLQDKSLIIMSRAHVSMHDLIQEMGREIVREQSIEKPGERSHLWNPDDIYRVLKHNEGTDIIESITFNMSRIKDLSLNPLSFARLVNLKFLRMYNYGTGYRVHLPKGLRILPDEIRLFQWDNYPSKSLPVKFNSEHLIEIRMRGSCAEKLWDGVQNLTNLKVVDLSNSKQLIELPDLSKASSLEDVFLYGCESLLHVHPSVFCLQKLVHMQLAYCKRLDNLRSDIPSRSLKGLCVSGCSNLKEFSLISNKMDALILDNTDIEALPSSVGHLNQLEYLHLLGCQRLKHLPNSLSKLRFLKDLNLCGCIQLDTSNLHILFDGLQSLRHLNLSGCWNLSELPENISQLSLLSWLSLEGTEIKGLPESIKHLSQLWCLYLTNCRRLKSLPELPPSVQLLNADNCTSLDRLFTPTLKLVEQHNRLCDSSFFSFKNCPNLDKRALDCILAYANGRKKYLDQRARDWCIYPETQASSRTSGVAQYISEVEPSAVEALVGMKMSKEPLQSTKNLKEFAPQPQPLDELELRVVDAMLVLSTTHDESTMAPPTKKLKEFVP